MNNTNKKQHSLQTWLQIPTTVRREGRLTPAQKRALETLLGKYALDPNHPLNPQTVFGSYKTLVLEIGFGNGENLLTQAQKHPQKAFLGIEVYRPGIGNFLQALEKAGLTNIRIYAADARQVLLRAIPDGVLDEVLVYFPDPWPKKRHHKRRLISPPFLPLLARKMRPGGILHISTDWPDYAQDMLNLLNTSPYFENLAPNQGFHPEAAQRRVMTKYEEKARREGRTIYELLFRRTQIPVTES